MRAGEIIELNTFVTVAQEGRFAQAAVRLGVTASAVSQSIRRIEARLGVRLFTRTTRSVALTEAGEALFQQARPALEQLAAADRLMAARHDGSSGGRACISVSAVAMELLVAPVLTAFRRAHPGVFLEVVVEDRVTDPVARRYDAVIRRGDLLEQDMIARRLSADDHLILVASPSYLAACSPLTHPGDLAGHRIVIRRPRSGGTLPWSLTRRGETVKVAGSASLSVDSAIAARQYAIDGLGIAFLAHDFVLGSLKTGSLTRIMPGWRCPAAGFHLMYAHRGGLPPIIQELERAMRLRQKTNARQGPQKRL
jgi:DNA-binding transcriptional LysR family regulator